MATDEQPAGGCPFWVRALLELSVEPALFVGRDGEVAEANGAALRLLDVHDASDLRAAWPRLDLGREDTGAERPRMLRTELKIGDQTRRLRLETQPVPDEDHPGQLITLRDEDRPGGHLLLASRMRMTSRLVQSLCHDLRTPLNSMVLQLELLRSDLGGTASDVDEHIDILSGQVESLARTVTTIYELTAVAGSDPEERFDLRTLAREALRFAHLLRMGGNVEIIGCLPDAPARVAGRRTQLIQALMTLIASALEGLVDEGRLDVVLECSARFATLTISARGSGVGYSVDDGTAERRGRRAAGAGAGADLDAARLAVERHGGTLRLDNGQGCARATLRLPLARAD